MRVLQHGSTGNSSSGNSGGGSTGTGSGNGEPTPKDKLIEELAKTLGEYISSDDETVKETIEYFIDAEAVTKLPYIERASSDEPTLQGQVKFYRYDENDEVYTTGSSGNTTLNSEHIITFVNQTDFKTKMEEYKSSGNEEVFKHFTLDKDGNVVIAYGSKEERTVTTADADITEAIVEEHSGENYYKDSNGNFKKIEYTIFEKSIDYLSLVEEYIMPSNFLYALLIQTRDSKFVKDIASIAYQNEIAIGIYNNETQVNITETYTYKKLLNLLGETSLNLSDLATVDPISTLTEATNITYTAIDSITSTNLPTEYPNMERRCFFNTVAGKIMHKAEKYNLTTTEETSHDDMYVKKTNTDGKITELGTLEDAKTFEITYEYQRNTESTPTVSVVLADTWIAKWQASYSKEVEEKENSSSNTLEDDVLLEYANKTEVLNILASTMNAETLLNTHASELKDQLIAEIMKGIDFTVTVTPELITVEEPKKEDPKLEDTNIPEPTKQTPVLLKEENDIDEAKRKELLGQHCEECEDCKSAVESWWKRKYNKKTEQGEELPELTAEDIYNELKAPRGNDLERTKVGEHYPTVIQDYITAENKAREDKAEADYQEALQEYETKKAEAEAKNEELKKAAEEAYKKALEEYETKKAEAEVKNEELKKAAAEESTKLTKEREDKFQEDLINQIKTNQTLSGNQTYLSINASSVTKTKKSLYKKDETIENSNVGEKFASVWKKADYYKAKEALIARIEWFWEYIREDEDTAKLENVIRHLFNIATESKDFGTFTDDEIKDLLFAFNPKQEMKPATATTSVLLKEYLHYFENSALQQYFAGNVAYTTVVAKYITEDKQNYIITDDGAGNAVVGFGIDIQNGGFLDEFQKAGYDVSIGAQIPVDFVDALEAKEIEACKDFINYLLIANELEFTLYQKFALYSRAYDCGHEGATEEQNGKTFVEAYTEYYNFEEDDKYGELVKDFEHELYKNYMDAPINPGTAVEQGLRRRRESEWILFNTGYFNVLDKWCGSADYPESLRTFQASGTVFPEYPQTGKVGDTNLYALERYGDPIHDRTMGQAGCGLFSMSVILSGLLGDSSIDPITFRDTMEAYLEENGKGIYSYTPGPGSGSYYGVIADPTMIKECYGVTSKLNPTKAEALQGLKEGKCALVSEPGHYVVAIPVPDEYQGQGEIFVIDSAFGETGIYASIEEYINKNQHNWDEKGYFSFVALISM